MLSKAAITVNTITCCKKEMNKIHCNIWLVKFFLQAAIFVALSTIFYFYYFTEVVQKFASGYTNVIVSHENILHGVKPPFLTFCMDPSVKVEVLTKYNISAGALNEPNSKEKNIHSNLNKTIEDFYREATFKLDEDFQIYLTLWQYTNKGWEPRKGKLVEGNSNFIDVSLPLFLIKFNSFELTFK